MYRIAVDIFGGDNAPQAILDGCALALESMHDIALLLVGDKGVIAPYVNEKHLERVEIVHAPEVITPHEQATAAIKKKKDSSLVKALNLLAQKEAACMVSAGSSGAVLAGATLLVRRIKGVKRPALAPFMPTRHSTVLLLDCGANVDCKPVYLQQFALMGAAYYSLVQGKENPRVGLLNNGAEAEKGNALTKAAYPLLERSPIHFVGNCESRDVLSGDYDVVVADGFAGNIVLKNTEGTATLLMKLLKDELTSDFKSKLGAALSKNAYARLKKKMDYTEYGGALLLGINGGVIKAHGSSNAKAIASAISQARAYAKCNVTEAIEKVLANTELEA